MGLLNNWPERSAGCVVVTVFPPLSDLRSAARTLSRQRRERASRLLCGIDGGEELLDGLVGGFDLAVRNFVTTS